MRSLSLFALVLFASALSANGERVSYRGHQVFKVNVPDMEAVRTVKSLDEMSFGFLSEVRAGRHAHIRAAPENVHYLKKFLRKEGLEFEVVVKDAQAVYDGELEAIRKRKEDRQSDAFDINEYHTLDEINQYMADLAAEFPDMVTGIDVGDTYEGRDILGIQVCGESGCGKPIMYIDSGIHAREWLGHATVLYMMDRMINGYGSDPEATNALDTFDWYFIPSANPDGYVYTWETDREWRKTRSFYAGNACVGTDPNRNFPYKWGEGGGSASSPNSCSETYRGPTEASEIEIQTMTAYIDSLDNVQYYQNMHCEAFLIMYPWGWDCDEENPDRDEQQRVGDIGNDALVAETGNRYEVGDICNVIYPADGGAVDWAYAVSGVPYPYTIELLLDGGVPFVTDTSYIDESGREMWAFHIAVADAIAETLP